MSLAEKRLAIRFSPALDAEPGTHVANLIFALTRQAKIREVVDDPGGAMILYSHSVSYFINPW
jgi:hypothetical protein